MKAVAVDCFTGLLHSELTPHEVAAWLGFGLTCYWTAACCSVLLLLLPLSPPPASLEYANGASASKRETSSEGKTNGVALQIQKPRQQQQQEKREEEKVTKQQLWHHQMQQGFSVWLNLSVWLKLSVWHLQQLVARCASRGKLHRESEQGLSVPRSFFSHFYVTGLLTNSTLLALLLSLPSHPPLPSTLPPHSPPHPHTPFPRGGEQRTMGLPFIHTLFLKPLGPCYTSADFETLMLLLLFESHLLRRCFEDFFFFSSPPSSRMHLGGYLVGISFYVAAPLTLFLHAAASCDSPQRNVLEPASHAGGTSPFSGGLTSTTAEADFLVCARLLLGSFLFVFGFRQQWRCHQILANLRRQHRPGVDKLPRENRYSIPFGGWFDLVACPHYFAEILVYAGLLVIGWGSIDSNMFLMFAWVVLNLSWAGAKTHNFYLKKFEAYPQSRRILFPYLW